MTVFGYKSALIPKPGVFTNLRLLLYLGHWWELKIKQLREANL